ncbi:MAG: hypothetical protein HYU52_08955, partial [Acidobacteria bacterium]|nr:hypothetical protein [Acidobacteriota bacterium]
GVRSYIHEGATVIVPPTTAPLVERIATATFDSRPDAQSRDPKPARVESVKETLLLEDRDNAMAVYNVASGHTDEYLVFHFPRQKVLLPGDLLFFRGADQPLKGRSRQLCETIEKLGIEVESMYVSWPLNGYGGVRDTVRFDEFRAACALPSP